MKNSHYNHYINLQPGFKSLDIIFLRKHKGAEAQEPKRRVHLWMRAAEVRAASYVKENSY